MEQDEYIWAQKYRPTTFDEWLGGSEMRGKLQGYVDLGELPHLLFSGPAGTGKTSAAKILTSHIPCDSLFLNASDENNIETVRNKIKTFASSQGFSPLKICVLDEADYLTPSAQAALRNVMEEFSVWCRFILTANYAEKIIEPIISRTQHFIITPPTFLEVAKHIKTILEKEQVSAKSADIQLLLDTYFPDIRKIINELQRNTVELPERAGALWFIIDRTELVQNDYKLKLIDILKSNEKKKFQSIRQLIADNKIRDFQPLYRLLFDKIGDYAPAIAISECILCIARGQYESALVIDKEITFCATILKIVEAIDETKSKQR
jgi:DNA polymerase III delta prime subunit